MKLTNMTLELAKNLMDQWIEEGDSRPDGQKDPDLLYHLLFEDGGKSQFYKTTNLLWILHEFQPAWGGGLFQLGMLTKDYDPKEGKKELISILREYEFKRLSFICPSPITAFAPKLREIGFKYEGRLKYSCVYNGKLADSDLYGFYSIKPETKRRRRGRRAKIKANSSQVGEQSQAAA